MRAIELLSQFNLSRNEATIYYALLTHGSMNGYQLAKLSGISRSNTYTTLSSLVQMGCAYVIEGESTMYSPLSIDEFCSNRLRTLELAKDALIALAPQKCEDQQGYITIAGSLHIRDKIKNMMSETRKRIYLSASKKLLDLFSNEIKTLAGKGIKVVIITDEATELDNTSIYISDTPIKQVRIISDSTKVLTGDFDESRDASCLYSEKKNLVDLIKDSIKNEMTLIEMQKTKSES
ncbi:MAG: TrmB family transcriptional regulator [Clostridia bacterium]|jgi:HTH-type transcriptional regulator, sugar sensing transcriptional regulator|nr:TrmB family transcriptional regulator [Clostridia bacterium]MBT7122970.1 TrmB family transcriptional regulator [Clostridia bacterium]